MHLSYKPKRFSHDFVAILESILNLEHFKEKPQPHTLNFSEIIHSEKRD